ncbi:hypothetical protein CFOL_v3_10321 [Cephalotus follicularis]|uniref:BHLH domain-containing protein n=1 Tax=Cephalotus follicularis TaxID=3775 RepID=A0A1Q3BFP3_CEPFO|nr:hypothetical protein CFOL_v3_10321 [Cephalotus follicularis]
MSSPFPPGQESSSPKLMNPCANMISTTGTLPVYAIPELLHPRGTQANEPCGRLYCLPRFRQASTPVSNSILKEQPLGCPCEEHKETLKPNAVSRCAHKRFLVFDRSGDQTTVIYSSGIGTPVQCQTSWVPKPHGTCNLNEEFPGTKRDLLLHSGAMSTDVFDEYNGTDVHSEMHEDTEELNALLYSDDESDSYKDDEVTSTDHSPSKMPAHNQQNCFDGSLEEVASSTGPTNKRKRYDTGYEDVPSFVDTASSMKLNRCIRYEDDAESICVNDNKPGPGEIDSLSGKRMRKDKIREMVSALQSLLPVGKDKDVTVVLDEAISYLKYLKHKAEALGLDAP